MYYIYMNAWKMKKKACYTWFLTMPRKVRSLTGILKAMLLLVLVITRTITKIKFGTILETC